MFVNRSEYLYNKNKTVIYVSHNIQESLLIGDEILIINEERKLVESFKNEIDKLNFLPLSEKFFNHEKINHNIFYFNFFNLFFPE